MIKDWFVHALAIIVVIGYFAEKCIMFFVHCDFVGKDILMSINTEANSALILVLSYYFGSTNQR